MLIAEVAGSREANSGRGEFISSKLVIILSKKEMRLVEAHLFVTNSCLLIFITICDYQLT